MKVFAICVLFVTQAVSMTMAAAKPKPQGLFITQDVADHDVNSVPYYIQSDGTGIYRDGLAGGISGDVSVLMDNVCGGLTYGDRLLDLQSAQVRKVAITLSSANALQPGNVGYVVPAQPLGTVLNSVRFMNKCTCGTNQSMFTMTPGSKILCPMHLRLSSIDSTGFYYRVDMGTAGEGETEQVQISCNSSGTDGKCNDWSIDPNSDPDLTANPGKTRARLVYISSSRGKNIESNHGAFYMTFHLHVTRQ